MFGLSHGPLATQEMAEMSRINFLLGAEQATTCRGGAHAATHTQAPAPARGGAPAPRTRSRRTHTPAVEPTASSATSTTHLAFPLSANGGGGGDTAQHLCTICVHHPARTTALADAVPSKFSCGHSRLLCAGCEARCDVCPYCRTPAPGYTAPADKMPCSAATDMDLGDSGVEDGGGLSPAATPTPTYLSPGDVHNESPSATPPASRSHSPSPDLVSAVPILSPPLGVHAGHAAAATTAGQHAHAHQFELPNLDLNDADFMNSIFADAGGLATFHAIDAIKRESDASTSCGGNFFRMDVTAAEQENAGHPPPPPPPPPMSTPQLPPTAASALALAPALAPAAAARVPLGVRQHRQASKPANHEARDAARPYGAAASNQTRVSKRRARRSVKAREAEEAVAASATAANAAKARTAKARTAKAAPRASGSRGRGRPASAATAAAKNRRRQPQPQPPQQQQRRGGSAALAVPLPTNLAESNEMSGRTPRRVGNPSEHGGLTDTDICDLEFDVLLKRIARFKPALQNKIKDRRRKLKNRIHARRAANKREGKQHSLSGVNTALERESIRLSSENERLMQDNQVLETRSYALNRELASHDEEMDMLQRKLRELQARVSEAQSQAVGIHVAPSC